MNFLQKQKTKSMANSKGDTGSAQSFRLELQPQKSIGARRSRQSPESPVLSSKSSVYAKAIPMITKKSIPVKKAE
jgi:hypothetical protein